MNRLDVIPARALDSEGYWSAADKAELRFQRCSDCSTFRHLPSPICADCRSFRYTWQLSAGLGKLHSWTVVRHPVHPAFADVPYIVALVEIDDCGRPRIVCNLDAPPEAVRAGMPVHVWFERRGEVTVPQGTLIIG
jgi:uncharacterized OB-fold protein